MSLKNEYPNYALAISQMKDTTDLQQGISNSKLFSHQMSYIVYGNKLADIYINLNQHEDFVYVSFASFKGFTEKAKTTGERIYGDLAVEEWIATIADVMNMHNANPHHAQLVMDFTRERVNRSQTTSVKNSGCMVSLFFLLLPIFTYYILT